MIYLPIYKNGNTKQLENVYSAYFKMLDGVLPFYRNDLNEAKRIILRHMNLMLDEIIVRPASVRSKEFKEFFSKHPASQIAKFDRTAAYSKHLISKDTRLYTYLYEGHTNPDDYHVNPERLASLLNYLPGSDTTLDEWESAPEGEDGKMLLEQVFRYDLLTSDSRREHVYALTGALGANVCPYCNHAFTFTVAGRKGSTFSTRPELDHYRSKSKYPFFAVSLRNLVPSCHVCNHSKGEQQDHLNPYQDDIGDDYRFWMVSNKTGYITGLLEDGEEVSIEGRVISEISASLDVHLKNSEQVFGWNEVYGRDKEFVLRLFRQRFYFNDDCLEMMYKGTEELFPGGVDELRELLHLRRDPKEHWGDYPLSKLVHDIELQIKELTRHT